MYLPSSSIAVTRPDFAAVPSLNHTSCPAATSYLRNHFGCIEPMRLLPNSQHSAATAAGSVITSMSSPRPVDTVSIVPLAGRSITALISLFVAARSLRSCALAFAPPAFNMFAVRTLPCVAILKLANAALTSFTELSLRSARSTTTGTSTSCDTSSSRRVRTSSHRSRHTALIMRLNRVQSFAASAVHVE